MNFGIPLFAVLGCIGLWTLHRREWRKIRAARRAMFGAVLPLLEEPRLSQQGMYFPVLAGRYRGRAVVLEPILDQMAVRKLPTLWLRVSVVAPIPYVGVFDYLARPTHTEFYSPSEDLPECIAVPAGWPPHATIRTDRPRDLPPLEVIERHMGLFADRAAKELLITPRGVRIVYLIGEAERSVYLLLRQPHFDTLEVPIEQARNLLDRAVDLVEALNDGEKTHPA